MSVDAGHEFGGWLYTCYTGEHTSLYIAGPFLDSSQHDVNSSVLGLTHCTQGFAAKRINFSFSIKANMQTKNVNYVHLRQCTEKKSHVYNA